MVRKIYLAGPFFNAAQVRLMESIELILTDAGIGFFSPRLASKKENEGPLDPASCDKIFAANVQGMLDCTDMLAVIDWVMPEGVQVRIVEPDPEYVVQTMVPGPAPGQVMSLDNCRGTLKSGPLNIPDAGTCFEMGFAFGHTRCMEADRDKHIRLWIFTIRSPNQPVNLMLTRAARGVIHGLDSLQKFVAGGRINPEVAQAWTGRNT